MEYAVELTIDLPRERVIELFDDPDNLPKWQEGLRSFEHISGELGQPGAKSRLLYDMGRRQVEMMETIEVRSLPDEFTGTYVADGVWNRVANRFFEQGDGTTRWQIDTEFRFSGFMKIMSLFMRSAFPKQTRETMESFKAFAESEGIRSGS
jgi:uncharacterized membrane protein